MANFIAEKLESLKSNKTIKPVEIITEPVKPVEEPTEPVAEEPRKYTIPDTCDKLEGVPKNVHYIQEPEPGTFFVVKLDEAPDRNRNTELTHQLLDNMYIYINDGDEEFNVKNLTGSWPYFRLPEKDKIVKIKERKSKGGEALVDGFIARLHKLKYVNGTLMYEHGGEQFRIQICEDTYKKFSFYLRGYDVWNMATKCEVSWWIITCTDRGSEISNGIHADIAYKHLRDIFQEGLNSLMKKDSEEDFSDDNKIRFLQGTYRDTPHHDYKDYDGNPCGEMEYWCSKTWTNEHYTLMTQCGDRAWDVERWLFGYITSMDYAHKNVDFRHFIWLACRLSSIGKTKMLEKCFPGLVVDPNPADGQDRFSVEEILSSPLMVADDGDLNGLAKNQSYSTILNKRVGSGQIYARFMRKNGKFVKRTTFNMSISNVEPPKELYSGDNTNIMTSKCRYVYVNLSDAVYRGDTSILNIEEISREIGRTIPDKFVTGPYTPEVDMFKSDCLRFYKANPHFMDKYLGAMKYANTSGAKTCFEDYVDEANAQNSWGCEYNDEEILMPLGQLFAKQLRNIDDYSILAQYFETWHDAQKLNCTKAKHRIKGVTKNPIVQRMVSKKMITDLYGK